MDIQIGIRVDQDMLDQIDLMAKEADRNRSDFIRIALKEWMKDRQDKKAGRVPA